MNIPFVRFFLARMHFPKNRETWANGQVYITCYIYIDIDCPIIFSSRVAHGGAHGPKNA